MVWTDPRRPFMRYQFRLKTLFGLVVGVALILAAYVWYTHTAPWEASGGMIGWSQAYIEDRLGPPARVVEGDVPDPHAQKIRLRPPGSYRTLFFRGSDGQFIVWLKEGSDGFACFGSSWTDKGCYY
jgi:hypothetical protein